MRRVNAVALGVLVVVAACAPAARVLTGELTGRGPVFTVVVDDRTGWIQGFRFVQPAMDDLQSSLAVENPNGQPSLLRVSWAGGACELTATLTVSQAADGLQLLLTERPACQEQMAAYRVIDLVFDRERCRPIPSTPSTPTSWFPDREFRERPSGWMPAARFPSDGRSDEGFHRQPTEFP